MIGDGMSLMHVYSAWTANRGKLFLDNCQAVGLSKTYCANKLITDSGAGGTAIATGQKTNYHSVGVDVEGLLTDCEALPVYPIYQHHRIG
jgi:alkaline phosphatase